MYDYTFTIPHGVSNLEYVRKLIEGPAACLERVENCVVAPSMK
jgi:hypothetical protein